MYAALSYLYLSPSGVDIDGDGTIAGELDLELRNINAGKVQLQVKVYRISDFPEYTGFMDKTGDVKGLGFRHTLVP